MTGVGGDGLEQTGMATAGQKAGTGARDPLGVRGGVPKASTGTGTTFVRQTDLLPGLTDRHPEGRTYRTVCLSIRVTLEGTA